MAKIFKQLGPGDYLYYTSPTTMGIKESLIEKAVDSQKHRGIRIFNILQNLSDVHEAMTETKIIMARDEGANVNQIVYLQAKESLMIVAGGKQSAPIVVSADRKLLEEWMINTK